MDESTLSDQQVEEAINYRWVPQRSRNDCGIAALAIVSGHTYTQVRSFFPGLTANGVTIGECAWYLRLFGCTVNPTKEPPLFHQGTDHWPPAPFAPVHLCRVKFGGRYSAGHWVVMLADGSVLDPSAQLPKQLCNYSFVDSVTGVCPQRSSDND